MPSLPTTLPDDPLPTVKGWLAEAEALGRRNTNAIALASTDRAGRPSVRMVLVKDLVAAGYLVFYTNYGSRKAVELEATGRAAAVIYWHELGRQVRFEGVVVRSPEAESDEYFATRPRQSQINAWSSEQSRSLADVGELERRAARVAVERGGGSPEQALPRPAFWGGYRLWLDAVELWVEGAHRFHERVRYERRLEPKDAHSFTADRWHWHRLQP